MTLSFPSDPINGAVSGEYTYDAAKTAWRKNAALPVSVTHSDVAPSNPRAGDQWWKSNEGTLFTYYNDGSSSQWVESTNVVANVEPNPIPAGAMMAWASDVIPANWLLCDGSAVSRSTYASLFAIIGTQYGSGDGTTTFNLPNLKGRTIVGKDSTQTEFDLLGETGGAKTHTLTASEMPSHTHTFSGTTSTDGSHYHTSGANSNGFVAHATGGGGYAVGFTNAGSGEMMFYRYTDYAGSHSHTYSGTTSSAGSGSAHNNLQPYIVLNYIIKFSAGETPGDSQLAVRVGAAEININSLISASPITVANQAARDAAFTSPVHGNAVFRTDLGMTERYLSLYNASTNPAGATPAGWYPDTAVQTMVRSSTNFSITQGQYNNCAASNLWDVVYSTPNVASYNAGFTIPFTGVWRISNSLVGMTNNTLFGFRLNNSVAPGSWVDLYGVSHQNSGTNQMSGYTIRKFSAGDRLYPMIYTNSTYIWYGTQSGYSDEGSITLEFIGPQR